MKRSKPQILTINGGSSSIKFALFEAGGSLKRILEGMIDRSYFYLGLNNLVALKPKLLADARLQNYCAGVEVAFNQKRKVAFDEEKADFLNFLNDVDVQPSLFDSPNT